MTTDPSKTDPSKDELLQIYRLHAELADRVSQRREGANRLYVSLLVGLMVFLTVLMRHNAGDIPVKSVFGAVGSLGALLSVSWYIVIRSYRQLNTGKFKALQELEKELAYEFFTREWELLGEGEDRRSYWKLTVVETSLPLIFFLLFLVLVALVFLPGPPVPLP